MEVLLFWIENQMNRSVLILLEPLIGKHCVTLRGIQHGVISCRPLFYSYELCCSDQLSEEL